ncbi:hypothetical protein BCR34DRAFT_663881 [Clohesyomyces aquaticus]|uniref:Transmembrane protein n=1 Tax=Clohesyomyces aquaticus TaxID=1231657 RepID=A0A1Y1ZQ11_9PLEO|nr:hypothetical protein BCR34DRAFT_663881 [Clohesyomyces aquaticus]
MTCDTFITLVGTTNATWGIPCGPALDIQYCFNDGDLCLSNNTCYTPAIKYGQGVMQLSNPYPYHCGGPNFTMTPPLQLSTLASISAALGNLSNNTTKVGIEVGISLGIAIHVVSAIVFFLWRRIHSNSATEQQNGRGDLDITMYMKLELPATTEMPLPPPSVARETDNARMRGGMVPAELVDMTTRSWLSTFIKNSSISQLTDKSLKGASENAPLISGQLLVLNVIREAQRSLSFTSIGQLSPFVQRHGQSRSGPLPTSMN